jgi:hypothetical protein
MFFWEKNDPKVGEGATLIGPITNFYEHLALLNISNSLDPNCKIETNVLPFSLPF